MPSLYYYTVEPSRITHEQTGRTERREADENARLLNKLSRAWTASMNTHLAGQDTPGEARIHGRSDRILPVEGA